MRLDGEDARQAAYPDAVGHNPGETADEGGKAGAHHGAQHGELVLEVDTVHGRFGHPEVGGDGSRHRDLPLVLLAANQNDANDRRRLSDVGESDQRPNRSATHALHQLQIHCVGSVVDTGDDQRCIEETEQGCTDGSEGAGHGGLGRETDAITNPATERADKGVRHDHCQQKRDKRHNHQIEVSRNDPLEVGLHPGQEDTRQQRRNDLGLIAHLLDHEQAEVPHLGSLLTNAVGVHQLR